MAKQIQLRRGTTAEHENFIGAPGEVTVDTDLNTLRVHDGETPGGHIVGGGETAPAPSITLPENMDYVVESQFPTADNNYTWYRKYASGWVEQGGVANTTSSGALNITLPVPMSPNKYFVTNSSRQPINSWTANSAVKKSEDGTSISIAIPSGGSWVAGTLDWEVKGLAA